MKVLLATMGLGIGGAETHIVELSKGLKKKGIEVVVASNGGEYVKELEDAGIIHYIVPMHNKNIFNVIKSYGLLKNIITKEKINIVHGHARIPSFICARLKKQMNFPFVTTAHWTFTTKHGLKYITKWGDKTIAVSEDIKKYLLDNYSNIKEENITVTVNGIDTEKFSKKIAYEDILKEFNIYDSSFRIVYISRLDDTRALVAKQLINITEKLKEVNEKIQVIIVGGGNVFDELSKNADEVNIKIGSNVIIMTGARSDINKFANMSDMFIGVSRSALEAMACEKPIIIAGNEGYIGIFDETKLNVGISTNFCCRDTKDSTEELLYEDIVKIMGDTFENLEKMGLYNKKTVETYYSVDKMVNDTIAVYNSFYNKNI